MLSFCLKIARQTASIFLIFLLTFLLGQTEVFATHQCGNGTCQPEGHHAETCSTCPQDCGVCSTPTPTPTSTPTSAPTPTSPSSTSGPSEPAPPSPYTGPTRYPSVFLNPQIPDPTSRTSLTFTGHASIEHGIIAGLQYSLDGDKTWTDFLPKDGRLDDDFEEFSLNVAFEEGQHTIQIRAKSLSQIFTKSEDYASDTFSIVSTPPKVELKQISPNPTNSQTPTISGSATSKFGKTTKVEISLDNGRTWFAAEQKGNGFTFTPQDALEDGNYLVRARAFDNAGNTSITDTQTLIVDTIPPIIGGSQINLGPQVLTPDKNGAVRVVPNADVTIALSAKGGVTQAIIYAAEEQFSLEPIETTNLWKSKLQFATPGIKAIEVEATDGAGNKTTRNIGQIIVENFGIALNEKDNLPVANAVFELFTYDEISKSWVLWDAASFGQKNPQETANGLYSFLVPPGSYYLEVKARGFHTTQSEIMNFDRETIINFSLFLQRKPSFSLYIPVLGNVTLSLPSAPKVIPRTELKTTMPLAPAQIGLANGTSAPDLLDVSLIGKKTLISFVSTWSTLSQEQIPVLSEVSQILVENQSLTVIFLQESSAIVETFMKRGNYKFSARANSNGEIAQSYKITTLPQHFLIDSQGKIQKVYLGVLGKEELLEKLAKLK